MLYLRILLYVLGKTIPKATGLSPEVKNEARGFPAGFGILLGVLPAGPALLLEADGSGGLFRCRDHAKKPDLAIQLKSLEAAFRLFTFRESTCASEAGGRLTATGSLPRVLSFIRIIDAVEILLLPRGIASRAVKEWRRPEKLLSDRARLYASILLPAAKGMDICSAK